MKQAASLSGSESTGKLPVSPSDYTLIDRWILERLHAITAECVSAYAAYDFRKVFTVVNSFFATELSALYIDITKDRMYCDAASSPRRRATQAAIREITETLCKLLAPILAFTADEVWEHLGHTDSLHLELFPGSKFNNQLQQLDHQVVDDVRELRHLRDVVQQQLEQARQNKLIGSNLEAQITVKLPIKQFGRKVLDDQQTVSEFLIVSGIDLHLEDRDDIFVEVLKTSHTKCGRCWRHLPEIGRHAEHPNLCQRCWEAVG